MTFYELHDDISEPLTICDGCASQAIDEGFRLGAMLVSAARCDSCGEEQEHARKLTRQERLEGLADSGCDTWEEYRGER